MRNLVIRLGLAIFVVSCAPAQSRADSIDTEVWVGAGAAWPDYRDKAMACVRGGAGIVLARYVAIGASGYGDRDHSYYFADATLNFPAIGLLEPYGRYHIGRRDHSSENAMAWTAGVRIGDDELHVFMEGFGIFEPEENYGVAFGVSF